MTPSNIEELRKDLWINMPRCECCTGINDVCTSDEPCTHCGHLLDFVERLILKKQTGAREDELQKLKNRSSKDAYFDIYTPDDWISHIDERLAQLKSDLGESKEK